MFRIESVSEEAAGGKVGVVYEELTKEMNLVPNVFKVLSLFPEALESYVGMFKILMLSNTELTRAVKEMIASTVSKINQCDYCLGHHKNFMVQFGIAPGISDQVVNDPQSAEISDAEKKLLYFVGKVTRYAFKVIDADVAVLKELGWTDRKILEATLVAAFFNNVNRFADALGVQPEG